jgi:heterodisulfide reductase subunit B
MNLRYSLFLGCTIPARARNYEMAVRAVGRRLGIEFIDIDEFACCGFPLKSINKDASILLSARNHCYAEREATDICVLCSACASELTEDSILLDQDNSLRQKVNEHLSRIGLVYRKGVKVRHFARILYEEIGPDKLKEEMRLNLDPLRLASHAGCHYLKPSHIYGRFDSHEWPESLDVMISITGAHPVDYMSKRSCCGGAILAVNEKTAMKMASEKLDELVQTGADGIVLICPFCSIMYDSNQKKIEGEFKKNYGIPVLYLPQVLGLAMGIEPHELGLNLNVVKTKGILKKIGISIS